MYIATDCNNNSTSYCNFPYSYDNNGKTKEAVFGAYNFQVKEIEVFAVDYKGKLLC